MRGFYLALWSVWCYSTPLYGQSQGHRLNPDFIAPYFLRAIFFVDSTVEAVVSALFTDSNVPDASERFTATKISVSVKVNVSIANILVYVTDDLNFAVFRALLAMRRSHLLEMWMLLALVTRFWRCLFWYDNAVDKIGHSLTVYRQYSNGEIRNCWFK